MSRRGEDKRPIYIPLFPDAYHRDATHLTTEEHGAYFLLLMAAWGSDDCGLPDDQRRLAALAKLPLARWKKIAPTILEFWTKNNGRLFQKRLRHEWNYVKSTRAKRKDAADVRWSKSNASACPNADANAPHQGEGEGEGGGPGPFQRRTSRGSDTYDADEPFGPAEGSA